MQADEPIDPKIWIEQITKALDRKLKPLASDTTSGNRVWTDHVLSAVGKLGKRYEFWVYGSEKFDGGEFLYDLCWLDYGSNNEWLVRVPLVLECEWLGLEDIKEDFQKLLVARAELRVMVFSGPNDRRLRDTKEDLTSYVEHFAQKAATEYYLLSGYDNAERHFRHSVVSYTDGTIQVDHL